MSNSCNSTRRFRAMAVFALVFFGLMTLPLHGLAVSPRPGLSADSEMARRFSAWNAGRAAKARAGAIAPQALSLPSPQGTLHPLALLVDFTDRPHDGIGSTTPHLAEDYVDLLFDFDISSPPTYPQLEPNTVREYFWEVSHYDYWNGQGTPERALLIEGDASSVSDWQTMPALYTDYWSGFDSNDMVQLVTDAIAQNADVDFSQFDKDGDGYVDALLVIHSGWGGEDSGDETDIWSQTLSFSPIDTGDTDGSGLPIYVDRAVILPEERFYEDDGVDNGNEEIAEIGVYCHEMMHLFGLPDLYDTTLNSKGIGAYGLMGYGLWGADMPPPAPEWPDTIIWPRTPNRPAHPTAWTKMKLGWLEPTVVESETTVSLARVEATPQALLVYADADQDEYFLVEHRGAFGYDQGLVPWLDGGLVIYHVDEQALALGGNRPNDNRYRKGVDVECADGLYVGGPEDGLDELDEQVNFRDNHIAPKSGSVIVGDMFFSDIGGATNVNYTLGPTSYALLTGNVSATTDTNLGNRSGILIEPQFTGDQLKLDSKTVRIVPGILDPLDITAMPDETQITLAWSASPTPATLGYRLHWSEAGGTTQIVELGDVLTYTLLGLKRDTLHNLRLAAYDDETDPLRESAGVLLQTTTLPTADPFNVEAVPGSSQLALTWEASPSTGITGYRLYWSDSGDAETVEELGDILSYELVGLSANTEYDLRLVAYDGMDVESPGVTLSAKTLEEKKSSGGGGGGCFLQILSQ